MGGLFAQVFYNYNDGGSPERPTFLYQTGNRTAIERSQLEGQVQYNFNLEKFLNADITVGADYRQAGSNTYNQVYGRNEENDDYNILGAYAQASFELSERFEFVAAGRFDAYFELGLKPWDIAAGELIVKEAGGTVVDARGGSESMENGQVLACSMKMLKPLMKAVVPAWGEAAK